MTIEFSCKDFQALWMNAFIHPQESEIVCLREIYAAVPRRLNCFSLAGTGKDGRDGCCLNGFEKDPLLVRRRAAVDEDNLCAPIPN